jgi:hypothetical protein
LLIAPLFASRDAQTRSREPERIFAPRKHGIEVICFNYGLPARSRCR